jgi:hypothetical protein
MIEEAFLQIGERNHPSVAAATTITKTTTGLPWRLPCIKHLQTRAENATELQTWKILAQSKPTFCYIRPAPTADHRHQKKPRGLLIANLSSSETTASRRRDRKDGLLTRAVLPNSTREHPTRV